MMDETAILVWAAGGCEPKSPQYDEDQLLSAVKAHHLGVRLDRLLSAAPTPWASASLRHAVRGLAADAHARSRCLHRAYAEVLGAAVGDTRPVLSKGIAYPLLAGTAEMVTWSVDLDLFSADPAGLVKTLVALGYEVDDKSPPEPFGRRVRHEFAKLRRGDMEIDLHSRFPAWGYPTGVAEPGRTEPSGQPAVWRCPSSLHRGEITIGQLLRERVSRRDSDGIRLDVTGEAMTALVSCCHLFSSYVTEFPALSATIRLGELANLGDLISAPSFDRPEFDRLTASSSAHDAVAYAFALLARFLGRRVDPPPEARFPGHPQPPRALWFARGEGSLLVSTSAVESPFEAVVKTTPTRDLVGHLGATQLRLGRWYGTPGCAAPAGPLSRVIVQDPAWADLPVRLICSSEPAGLEFRVDLPPPAVGTETNILLYLDPDVYECIEHPGGQMFSYDRRHETRLGPATIPFGRSGDGAYRVVLPWTTVPPDRPPARQTLSMLLGVRRWQPDGDRPAASILVPLEIQPTA